MKSLNTIQMNKKMTQIQNIIQMKMSQKKRQNYLNMQALLRHLCLHPLKEEVSAWMTYMIVLSLIVVLWNVFVAWCLKALPYCWHKATRPVHCLWCFQYSGMLHYCTRVLFFSMKSKHLWEWQWFKTKQCIAYLSMIKHCRQIIPQGLSWWSCHHLIPMHSSLGSMIVHLGAWTIAKNILTKGIAILTKGRAKELEIKT